MRKKLVVAITGASGSIYAATLLKKLESIKDQIESCGVVMSTNARDIWSYELGSEPPVLEYPFLKYQKNNFYAPFASGSAGYDAMLIVPCSMGTLGRIAAGVSDDLVTRAADVMLKERKKLIVVPRETPYSLIHLQNMTRLTEAGAIICPASPSFYSRPETLEEAASTVINRVIDLAGLKVDSYRWPGAPSH
ncbi:UbiX family flavin prenyltransferase [Prolixibacter sp. SD074]|jgi:4-hydroxy-3-polyprenylbenzoate decarboxylase|uniref:UbiX family flavin prenyltransferase n=1 Tax=Prolixibacter sp. SD074 TaxID=2652391 RepID=UPI00126B5BA2|nr:UbiX family flavin prenyltransferase [Prolixibacter sp. SD074]GET30357.1 aromatic acid decarboxylase [Prolixibacter sp. SD074]